jgi:xylose dehydrogenase (NAD/NADP)
MERLLRWGIIGTGNIAGQFASGMAGSRRGRIIAAGSRNEASAKAFSQGHGIGSSHGSYADLLADREVEAVYLSLPNSLHHEWTLKALAAGKHVLCEKPIATNAAQAEEMFDAAQKTGRLLVEAFMYVSHPQTEAVLKAVRGGAIGALRLVRTSFCYRTNKLDGNIRFSREMAGGALMDVGCYCLHFSRLMMASEPTSVHAVAQMHENGVDELTAGVLGFAGGAAATFSCGTRVQADNMANICGTEGYIEVPVPWKPALTGANFTIARSVPPKQDGATANPLPPRQTITADATGPLYAMEADDFAEAALDGVAPTISRADSLGNMRVLDEIRRQIGLTWKFE